MRSARTPRQVAVLYAIFFVSGFCGLIYESIWSHYLKLLLGHAAYAQAVVLVVFVGGLAVGAWLAGRFSERLRHPVLLYAAIEAAVGIFAFAFQRLFEGATAWATSSFLPAACGEPGPCAASWLLATALILPPAVLLGTTFPLMSAGVMRLGVRPGRSLSLLYFLNSFGAALGVLASGFLLIPRLGLPGTILLAGAFNVLVALLAFVAWKTASGQDLVAPPLQAEAAARATADTRLLLAVAALTGLSSFVYEVVWIRMLTLVFGAATHSFELMLAPFILGLAIGAWIVRERIDAAASPLRMLAVIQVAMGVLAVLTLPLYAVQFDGMAFLLRTLARSDAGYDVYLLASGLGAALVMLPATLCAGMTLPLMTAILLRQGAGERAIGRVYGINTVGAIVGVLLAVHVLMPAIGLKWSLAAAAAIDVLLGMTVWMRVAGGPQPFLASRASAAVALAAAALVILPLVTAIDATRLGSGVFRSGKASLDGTVLFHKDGKTATITVSESPAGVRTVRTNGKADGASHPNRALVTPDDHTVYLLGALGPLHHPAARRAAVIGMGTGNTSAVLLEVPSLEVVDTIEIEPAMVEAAQLFRPRVDRVFDDPRSRIVIDDARAHFARTREHYDIIVSEPSNPWVSGVASLFTVEFYRHVAAHLADDGHFVQWLHLYETTPQVVGSIVGAFGTVFPQFVAYGSNDADVILVARKDGRPPALDRSAWSRWPALAARLAEIDIPSPEALAAHGTGPGTPIRVLAHAAGAPPNSDYFPFVDNHAARARFRHGPRPNLFFIQHAPVPILEYFTGVPAHVGHVRTAGRASPMTVRFAATGYHAARALHGEPLAPEERAFTQDLDMEIALVRSAWSSCTLPEGTGGAWLATLRLAAYVNPALRPEQAVPLWQGLKQRCERALSPQQRNWLDLYAAVAARDAPASAQLGAALLAEDEELTADSRAYAALAAVTGLLAQGDRAGAARLLDAQRKLLPPQVMGQPWFHYLVQVLATNGQGA